MPLIRHNKHGWLNSYMGYQIRRKRFKEANLGSKLNFLESNLRNSTL